MSDDTLDRHPVRLTGEARASRRRPAVSRSHLVLVDKDLDVRHVTSREQAHAIELQWVESHRGRRVLDDIGGVGCKGRGTPFDSS